MLETGNPVAMPWRDKVRAIVEAWYPGQAGGQAIAEVLTGAVNPSGRLPITFPGRPRPDAAAGAARPGHAVGHPDHDPTTTRAPRSATAGSRKTGAKPLYAFGHGLSYTTFDYSDLEVERR